MSTQILFKISTLASSVAASLLACGAAHAQTATPAPAAPAASAAAEGSSAATQDNSDVQSVVVTGFGRAQQLQRAPGAISVIDGNALQTKGASGFSDYLQSLPGVNFTQGNLGGSRVTIRGISDGLGATDPLTTVYIDNLPVTETYGGTFDPDVYDVDRVEVLKGPQGTLYGAGSMGGTVRVVTKSPNLNKRELIVDGGVGGTSGGGTSTRLDTVVNAPIVDDLLAVRISAGTRKDAGWIDDVVRGQKDGNSLERKSLHAQALLSPTVDTSITLGFMYQKDDQGLPWYEDLDLGRDETGRIYRASSESRARATTLTIEHDWDWGSLISATNYLDKNSVRGDDSSGSLRPLVAKFEGVTLGADEGIGLDTNEHYHLTTEEVRLTSSGKHLFDWVAGLYYSKGTVDYRQTFDFDQAPTVAAVVSGSGFYDSQQKYSTRQTAEFGELTYNATDKLSATVGLRFFDVNQHNTVVSRGTLNGGGSTTDISGGDSSHTQKYLLKYQATQDNMVYASASQGYRNGGPTGAIPTASCGAPAAALGYSSIPASYSPDNLWSYELGSKNTLLNGKMTFNASAFYVDWNNVQTTIGLSCGFSFVANAGNAKSQGAEFDMSVQPMSGLTFSGALSYVDATITKAAAGTSARDGDELPLTSKWSGNLAVQYERALGSGYTGFAGADASYTGSRWTTFQGSATAARLGAYSLGNIRLGVKKDNWSIWAYINNVADVHYLTNKAPTSNPAYETVGRPRTYAVNAKFAF